MIDNIFKLIEFILIVTIKRYYKILSIEKKYKVFT